MSVKVQPSEDNTVYKCLKCGRTFTLPNHRCTKRCPCGSTQVLTEKGYNKLPNGNIVI